MLQFMNNDLICCKNLSVISLFIKKDLYETMSQTDQNQKSQIQYDLISLQDLDEVNELLVNEFFRNEPLGKHLGANPETDVRPWISKVTEPLIAQGVSIDQN